MTLTKWIETQQIISHERNDWQQGREILVSRLELVQREVALLEEKIKQAEASVAEADKKRAELVAENDLLKADGSNLAVSVGEMESRILRLVRQLPEPMQGKLSPLTQRVPADTAESRVSVAERFQNVLGILNEVNKQNGEITVSYEVRELANGRPSEVRALYVGLAQGYYVSASGEAGVGTPTADGWAWKPSAILAKDVLNALEILQGKQTPAFVPLPVRIQ